MNESATVFGKTRLGSAFDVEMIFHSPVMQIKLIFTAQNGCALGLILRVFGTRK